MTAMLQKTTVVHIRQSRNGDRGGDGETFIGRGSRWGNPFVLGKEGTRAQVIDKYRQWITTQPELLAAVGELRGQTLVCYCAPLACHGDVLAALADSTGDPDPATAQRGDSVVPATVTRGVSTVSSDPVTASRAQRPVGVIDRFDGEYRWLSNYSPHPVVFEGRTYPTGEHAFAAAKTLDDGMRWTIANAPTPGEAKRLGRSAKLRPGWDDTVRYQAMTAILDSKFTDLDLVARLLDTEDDLLIEGTTWHDNHWGDCTCPKHRSTVGQNHLGRTLMRLRSELRGEPATRWTRVLATGHRAHDLTDDQLAWVQQELARIAIKLRDQHGTRVAIHGGATGADLLWAEAAATAGIETGWAYLPYPTQADRYDPYWADLYRRHTTIGHGNITRSATLLDHPPRNRGEAAGTLHARNDWMLRDGTAIVAVLDPARVYANRTDARDGYAEKGSGTAAALRANDGRLPVIKLDVAARRVSIAGRATK